MKVRPKEKGRELQRRMITAAVREERANDPLEKTAIRVTPVNPTNHLREMMEIQEARTGATSLLQGTTEDQAVHTVHLLLHPAEAAVVRLLHVRQARVQVQEAVDVQVPDKDV